MLAGHVWSQQEEHHHPLAERRTPNADSTDDALRGASVRGLQQQFLELSAELIAVTAAETDACIERAFSTLGTRLGLDLVAVVQLDSAVNYCAPAAASRGMFANPRMSAERCERLLAWLTIQARREVAVVFPAP